MLLSWSGDGGVVVVICLGGVVVWLERCCCDLLKEILLSAWKDGVGVVVR